MSGLAWWFAACTPDAAPIGTVRVEGGFLVERAGPDQRVAISAAQERWLAAHDDPPVLHRYTSMPFLTLGAPEKLPPQPSVWSADAVIVVDQAFDPGALVGGACFTRDCGPGGQEATRSAGVHGASVVSLIRSQHVDEVVGVRVFDAHGQMRLVDLLRALEWIAEAETPPRVVNLSLGLHGGDGAVQVWSTPDACVAANPALAWAIAAILRRGTSVVAAAGDDFHHDAIAAPACLPGVIAVAAEGPDGVPDWANRSPSVHVFGPGVDVPVGGVTASGSSLAAATVSGWVATGVAIRRR